MSKTTILENVKNRVQYLLERQGDSGFMEVEWATAICEELERMTERIEELEEKMK